MGQSLANRSIPLFVRTNVIACLFTLSIAWGVSLFWLTPRLPLVDMPQHTGQIALMHDLLTVVMPAAVAFKVILSVAYVLFVCSLVRLRLSGSSHS